MHFQIASDRARMRDMDQARHLRLLFLLVAVGCGRTPPGAFASRAGGSGALASGGTASGGGTSGTGATGGTTSGRQPPGAPCTGDRDCEEDAQCCDGSSQSCDVTRLPAGDGNNPGQLVYAGDDLTVRDTITGLVWQRDVSSHPPGCSGNNGGCTWSEAKAYCASLTLNGDADFRLPSRMELLTIADHTRASPALDPRAFPITPDRDFWSSTPAVDTRGDGGSYVSFFLGTTSMADSSSALSVRCVRGARCVPTIRFAVLGGGMVKDNVTGLLWQQQLGPNDMAWSEALSYCSTVGTGFRLPTVKELASLMELTAASPGATTAFPDIAQISKRAFWASTPYVVSPGAAWMVGRTASLVQDVSGHFWAWCVR